MTIQTSTLDSGITVVTEHVPHVHSVAASYWVPIGARDETDNEIGASHFLEHLLFKGTEDRSAESIAEQVDAGGGDMNAFTTREYTAFYVRLLAEQAEEGFSLLSDITWRPAFRPQEVEAERQVILEEILMHADEPSDEVADVFSEAMFPSHPLGRQVLGDEESINGITRDDIVSFHERWYSPAITIVAAAGAVEHDQVVEWVEKGLPDTRRGREADVPARTPPLAPPQPIAVVTRDSEQAHIVVGMRSAPADDPDRYALVVVDHILGGGLSSRLFQEIREKRGLAYSVYSYRSAYTDAGVLGVYAGTAPGHVHEVLALIHSELDRLSFGITERELELAKRHLRGSIALGLEDTGARMNRLGRSQLVHGRVPDVEELLAEIEVLTVGDLKRVIDRTLANPRTQAVIGPFDDSGFVGLAS